MSKPSDEALIQAAKKKYHKDGEIEIDGLKDPLPKARVSHGEDPGAYVLAWVWVYYEEAKT